MLQSLWLFVHGFDHMKLERKSQKRKEHGKIDPEFIGFVPLFVENIFAELAN